MNDLTKAIAEVVWMTSRNDEGSISATGANIVAEAVVAHLGLEEEHTYEWGETPYRRLVSKWVKA